MIDCLLTCLRTESLRSIPPIPEQSVNLRIVGWIPHARFKVDLPLTAERNTLFQQEVSHDVRMTERRGSGKVSSTVHNPVCRQIMPG